MTSPGFGRWSSVIAGVFLASCGRAGEVSETSGAETVILSEARVLAEACSGCHLDSGQAIASLDGLSADAIAASMRRYKSEDGSTVMHRMAKGYSDDQILAIAEYLETQRGAPTP